MLKSNNDTRDFKHLILPNGLQVLLVEDHKSAKSACCATFQAGHFDDPAECQGLAHLLEHMLFLGNHEFPEVNGLNNFVTAHGGNVNASTATEYTSVYFDVLAEQLEPALAQFAAMLTAPLFAEQAIEREIQAIDAEYKLKLKDDLRRLYQVHKETCNPAHPFSQFSVGNQAIFGQFSMSELRAKLLAFHKQYFSPANCRLCVISPLPLCASQAIVEQCFASWQGQPPAHRQALAPLYLAEQLGVQINIKPLQNARRLIITFALPAQHQHYRSKPLSVLSHILGDEGDGGLLDYYKKQNWASSLSAGGGIEGSNFKDFNINLQLSEQGLLAIDQIIGALFAYIKLIKQQGMNAWRIEEISTLNHLLWQYGEGQKPIDEALKLSHNLFDYPPQHCLAGDYILDQPALTAVEQLLAYFCPDNMRIKLIHQHQQTNKTARWYHTPYAIEKISPQRMAQFQQPAGLSELKLPNRNPYLSHELTTNTPDLGYQLPQRLVKQDGLELWFGQEPRFIQAKGDCFLTFDCAASTEGLHSACYKRLWVALINEKLKQRYYQANLAGLHFNLYPHQGGFSLQTNGFSAKQLDFCSHLLSQIVVQEDFSASFEQVKQRQHQALCNSLLNKPVNRLFTRLSVLLQQYNYAPADMADIFAAATLSDVLNVKRQLLDSFYLEGMMYGNWGLSEAQQVIEKTKEFRQQHHVNAPLAKGLIDLRGREPHWHFVDNQHDDEATVLYLQAPQADIKYTALTILFEQLIATPFFNQMRTERQLGYLVGTGYIPYNQHPGIALYIQSPHKSGVELAGIIQAYLLEFHAQLEQFRSIWSSLKSGVIRQLSANDTSMSMKSQRLWVAIGNKDFNFDYHEQMINLIKSLEFSDLITFSEELVQGSYFGQLTLISSNKLPDALPGQHQLINSIQAFKNSSHYLY